MLIQGTAKYLNVWSRVYDMKCGWRYTWRKARNRMWQVFNIMSRKESGASVGNKKVLCNGAIRSGKTKEFSLGDILVNEVEDWRQKDQLRSLKSSK